MKNKKTIILLVVVALLLAAMLLAYQTFGPSATAGEKTITVHVDHLAGDDATFTYTTDAEFLRDVLEGEGLITGTESQYGMWVTTVDGEIADEALQQWWSFDVNGEYAQYGVDDQPIADGDVFDFSLNVGW